MSGSKLDPWCKRNGLVLPVAFLCQIGVGEEVGSPAALLPPPCGGMGDSSTSTVWCFLVDTFCQDMLLLHSWV